MIKLFQFDGSVFFFFFFHCRPTSRCFLLVVILCVCVCLCRCLVRHRAIVRGHKNMRLYHAVFLLITFAMLWGTSLFISSSIDMLNRTCCRLTESTSTKFNNKYAQKPVQIWIFHETALWALLLLFSLFFFYSFIESLYDPTNFEIVLFTCSH